MPSGRHTIPSIDVKAVVDSVIMDCKFLERNPSQQVLPRISLKNMKIESEYEIQ